MAARQLPVLCCWLEVFVVMQQRVVDARAASMLLFALPMCKHTQGVATGSAFMLRAAL
jgi:hypothetical protein